MAHRDDVLNAIYEASRLHIEFGAESYTQDREGRVDVFGMLVERDIPVLFRPLQGLLGAYIDSPDRGVIITSRRPLRVQRFTAAHELGHAMLGHQASLDNDEILTRALFESARGFDRRELQANAFATQLLTPSWLIVQHLKRQGWTRESLINPSVVYQLSLRMGSSYAATCYALEDVGAIDGPTRQRLRSVTPRTIKQQLVRDYQPASWHRDVWLVTSSDQGMVLEGSRSDLVVFEFEEHAASGYVWQFGDLMAAGLTVKGDERKSAAGEGYVGGIVFRSIVAEPEANHGANGHVVLQERRPWETSGSPLNSLEVDVAFSGPVPDGLLPAQRAAALAAA